jgi:hypothetical protein
LKFDSQRPYPSLDDFGISADAEGISKAAADHNCSTSSDSSKMEQGVTVAEIRPIADTIRKAFGLELFGFDILVARTEDNRKEMLVVDVN